MSADDIRNSASEMTRSELIVAEKICETEMWLWSEALDTITHYLTMMEEEE
jgi:hypothetical protein